ncbi:MAG TPA: TIGR03089 family protein [Mycobacteriales bacterium]|nr:TIGR03089 family protein [Mycobacteriales bacterium]
MAATDSLLAGALRRDQAGPLLTYYDDRTGERVELSAGTLANWVAKTANLLVDDVGLAPGERVAVLLPAHWQTAAVLLGGWAAGAVLTTDPVAATVAFCTADAVAGCVAAGVPEIFALPLAPLGRGFDGEPPAGARDYPADVRGQGDRFAGPPVPPTAAALAGDATAGTPDTSGAELVTLATARATGLGLLPGDRILSVTGWDAPADWVDGLLAPLAAGASVVLCPFPDLDRLPARVAAEQVTATLGVTVAAVRTL